MLDKLLCMMGLRVGDVYTDPRLAAVIVDLQRSVEEHTAEVQWLAEELRGMLPPVRRVK